MIRARRAETLCGDEGLVDAIDRQFERHADEWEAERMEGMKAALRECLEEMAERSRSLLFGFYHGSQSCRDLAGSLGSTENAVRLTLHRARTQLKDCMQRRRASTEG
jgi:DNA-directed RNA polymerase specialized sigma24 family protein